MTELNHTIVWCRDRHRSATFLAEILDRPAPKEFGPFLVVEMDNGVSLDFMEKEGDIASQHYAFLINEQEFDGVLQRVRARGISHWADPGRSRANRINRNDGGRGFYFEDPNGHFLEVLTQPYGSDVLGGSKPSAAGTMP